MPSQDVIQKTNELINSLKQLASTSENVGTHLTNLEAIIGQIQGLNLTNIKETSMHVANFSRELKLLGGERAQVAQINTAFLDLTRTIEVANTVLNQFTAMSRMSSGIRKARNIPLGPEESREDWINAWKQQSKLYNEQKTIASQSRKALQDAEKIWQENLIYAKGINELRNLISRTLNVGGIVPQLPSGQLGGMVPQLPAGRLGGMVPQLPARVTPTYSDYEQQQAQEQERNRILQLSAGTGPKLLPAHISVREEIFPETDAENLRTQTSAVGNLADELERLGYTEAERKQFKFFDEQSLRNAGLSQTAAKNLANELERLGMKGGVIRNATTEMSTGITTVSLAAKTGTGVLQTFTAHIDRNGNVLQDTQKRFRSFGSAVMRDVVEVLKWTIAITAIYTPIRKLGELLEEMKKIQLDLVDVQIVLGDSTYQFATVLEAAAQIATQTSSSLEGVIEGYSLAAAAAASAGNETQRTVVTQTMLKDSMVLSKLANIDQKQALDTLVGSLSQLGMGLTQGTQLLDSWVAVSKKANVSVNQMATSFTIVGSAAAEAGVNYNELNALIGALAQSTNLSADELGNAIRGIIAAMQTDKAQQAFAEYGIATKTVSGDFRDLMDILKQLKQMSESGLLDEKAMGALTQAGGAGARRGAQLSALIKNLDVVMDLVTVSEQASGDAAQALGLEMGTLDAATTRLNNAFSELAVTLGTEGGVLGFLTQMTNLMTSLVKVTGNLTSALKMAAPVLATFMLSKGIMGTKAGAGLLNKNIPTNLAQMFIPQAFSGTDIATGKPLTGVGRLNRLSPISNWLLGRTQATGLGAQMVEGSAIAGAARTATAGEFFGGMWNKINTPFAAMLAQRRGMETPALPLGLGKVSLSTLLGPLMIAASNIGQPGGGSRAITGGLGALPGILKGSGVWATIGSIMATAFYDKFLTFEDDLAATWAAKIAENRAKMEEEKTPEGELTRLNREARESMDMWEVFKVNAANWAMNTWSKLPWSTQGGKQVTPEETGLGLALLGTGALDEDTRKRYIEAYNKLMRDLAESDVVIVPETQQTEIARLAATASADIMDKAMEQIALGAEGSIQNYLDTQTLAQKIGSTVTGLINAQLLLMQPVTVGVGAAAQTITPAPAGFKPMTSQEAVKFIAGLNSQEAGAIVSYYTEAADLLDKIRILNEQIAGQEGGIASTSQQKDLDAYILLLKSLPQEFVRMMQVVEQGSKYRKIDEKLLPTLELPEMTPQQYQQVATEAERFWREYLKASGLTDEEINAWIKAQNEALVTMQGKITPFKTNIPQQYFAPAMEGMGITGQMPGLVDWQQYTMAQFQQAQSMYAPFIKAIQQALPGWKPEESDALYFLKDEATVAHLDQTIMQMLMRDLIDIEKEKGLQGMYNLPAGATFYVPVTAYEMSKATVTEMAGGGGGISEQDLLAMVQALITQGATARLQESQQLFEQQQQQGIQNLGAVEPGKGFAIGGQEYKMFGPAVPEENLLGYTQGNPLPVMVTNWNLVPGNKNGPPEVYNPSLRVEREYEGYNKSEPPQLGELPPWLQWGENMGPALSKLTEILGRIFGLESLNTGIQNQTYSVPLERPTVTTALNLAVDQRVTLTVDGRTLATIIKPYLYEDLLRFGASNPTSVSRSVIA